MGIHSYQVLGELSAEALPRQYGDLLHSYGQEAGSFLQPGNRIENDPHYEDRNLRNLGGSCKHQTWMRCKAKLQAAESLEEPSTQLFVIQVSGKVSGVLATQPFRAQTAQTWMFGSKRLLIGASAHCGQLTERMLGFFRLWRCQN